MDYNAIIEKYYLKGTKLYDILLSHSSSVAEKAVLIAVHRSLDLDLGFIRQAAMLHDIGVFLTKAPSIDCFGKHQYIEHGYLGAEILIKEGYHKHALVCERHIGTGISKEEIIRRNLPLPHRDMKPISLEEQLICYADLFYSKTKLGEKSSMEKIIKQAYFFGEKSVIQIKKWNEMFCID